MQTAAQLKAFIGKFATPNQRLIRAVRKALRARFPTAFEIVYDNYNFLVIGYSPTEKTSDAIISVAAYAKGINLFFLDGKRLPDPKKVLQGSGKSVRMIRVESPETLKRPEVDALLAAAAARANFESAPRGKLIIRSVSKKQRPRQ